MRILLLLLLLLLVRMISKVKDVDAQQLSLLCFFFRAARNIFRRDCAAKSGRILFDWIRSVFEVRTIR